MQAPGQVQRGSGGGSEGSGDELGGFATEPGHVQRSSGKGSGEGLGQVKGSGEGSVEGSGKP